MDYYFLYPSSSKAVLPPKVGQSVAPVRATTNLEKGWEVGTWRIERNLLNYVYPSRLFYFNIHRDFLDKAMYNVY